LEARERNVEYYIPADAAVAPFGVWRGSLSDARVRAAISARTARLRGGNFSDSRSIGQGAFKNRIDFGPGLRVYYGVDGENIFLLLGGDKSTQSKDIVTAQVYWREYKRRKADAEKHQLQSGPAGRSPKR
jgi:putative addiction module killer protein